MKKMSSIAIALILLIISCKQNSQKTQKQMNQPVTSIDSTNEKVLSPVTSMDSTKEKALSPLIAGEVVLKDDAFGKIIELKGESKYVDQVFKISDFQMMAVENRLIVKNINGDNLFMVFSLPDFKFVKSFGRSGQGPFEFTYPKLVKADDKDSLCYIYEETNKIIYSLSRQLELKELPVSLSRLYISFGTTQLHGFSESDFVSTGPIKGGTAIYRLHSQGDSTSKKLVYNLSFSKRYRSWGSYIGDFGASKKHDRMVFAYKYFKRLVFMDIAGEKARTIIFKEKEPKPGDDITMLRPDTDNVTYYWGMSAQENYLYVLYSGRVPLVVMKQLNKGLEYIYVEQFDWNGNPIRKFKLDHWGFFCVDEKENKIYMASHTEDNPFLVYKLPKLTGDVNSNPAKLDKNL